MAAAPGVSGLETLTRGHGVKFSPPDGATMEECALVVVDIVGHGSVKSASRMNKMVVVFVGSTDKADQLVAAGVAVKGERRPFYILDRIKWFLRVTKGQKSVQVEDYFPDLQLFLDSVKVCAKMERFGQPAFNDRETYRLKKMMAKIRAQLASAASA